MKRKPLSWYFVFLALCAGFGLGLHAAQEAQAPGVQLVGAWSGTVHYGSEAKAIGLRFETDKKSSAVMFLSLPDLKFHDLGPIQVQAQGDEYKAYQLTFRLASDSKSIRGAWRFDGNELAFELVPGALPDAPPTPPIAGRIAQPVWTFKTQGAIWSSPVVAGATVYFGSNDGIIYALVAATGKPVWQFKAGGRVMGPVTQEGQHIYALSDDGYLYKVQQQGGKLVWRFDTHGGSVARDMVGSGTDAYDYLTSAATVADGTVYIGSADKKLYAVDSATGREKWHFDTGGIVRSTPVVANGRVFFGSRDNNIYSVDAKTGALKWKYDTLREVVSTPAVADGIVYIGSRDSNLFALDAATGMLKWKYFYWSSWVESSARLRDGVLYVGSSDWQQLLAIEVATGKRIWSFGTDGSAWSTPALTDKYVYIGAVGVLHYFMEHRGGFFAVERGTGKVAWRYPMAEVPGSETYGVASSPATASGLVFFGGLDGTFYAFRAEG